MCVSFSLSHILVFLSLRLNKIEVNLPECCNTYIYIGLYIVVWNIGVFQVCLMQCWCAPACESGPTSAEGGASLDSVPYTFCCVCFRCGWNCKRQITDCETVYCTTAKYYLVSLFPWSAVCRRTHVISTKAAWTIRITHLWYCIPRNEKHNFAGVNVQQGVICFI